MPRIVRDDPEHPDPGLAELYASLPDETDLEPWLTWCRAAAGPVLYLGAGAGRLAVPLARAGVELVAVDAHPGMLEVLARRLPGVRLVRSRIEDLRLDRRFDLVIGPSGVLGGARLLAAAARHCGRRVALELANPHWLAAGAGPGVRVRLLTRERMELEVDFPGGWVEEARARPVWPEEVEALLRPAGLELEVMLGAHPDAELEECPTYYVLARRPPEVALEPAITPDEQSIL